MKPAIVEMDGGLEVVTWDDDAPIVGLQISRFNWRLRRAREAKGWSRAELARRAGLNATTVGDAELLRRIGAQARWKLALALGVPEDVLFPGEIDELPADGPERLEVGITHDDMAALLGGNPRLDLEERGALAALRGDLGSVLDTLTPRERRVIRLRFGIETGEPMTLKSVAREFGMTPERIRQIEAKALRKLRNPRRTRTLRGYLDEPPSRSGKRGDRASKGCAREAVGETRCVDYFPPRDWMIMQPVEDLRKPMGWCDRCWAIFVNSRESGQPS